MIYQRTGAQDRSATQRAKAQCCNAGLFAP
jgi:hypothetical protein